MQRGISQGCETFDSWARRGLFKDESSAPEPRPAKKMALAGGGRPIGWLMAAAQSPRKRAYGCSRTMAAQASARDSAGHGISIGRWGSVESSPCGPLRPGGHRPFGGRSALAANPFHCPSAAAAPFAYFKRFRRLPWQIKPGNGRRPAGQALWLTGPGAAQAAGGVLPERPTLAAVLRQPRAAAAEGVFRFVVPGRGAVEPALSRTNSRFYRLAARPRHAGAQGARESRRDPAPSDDLGPPSFSGSC